MFTRVRGRLSGWLAGLALWSVLGFGQVEVIEHPQNMTVCVGEVATFSSETDGGLTGWFFNNTPLQNLPYDTGNQINVVETDTPDGTRIEELIVFFNATFNGLKVQSTVGEFGGSFVNSTTAYLFYKPNQQFPATGLIGAVKNGTAQIYWNAHNSNFTTQYLFGVYDHNNHLIVNQTVNATQISYDLPDSACHRLTFKVTANQCPDPENGFIQTEGATIDYREPNIDISPVTAEFNNNQTVLVSWAADGDGAFQIVVTDLGSGNQTAYNSTQPFSYMAAGCGQPVSLNVSVSPAECANDPAFTHSTTVSFTIPCPTTATEATEPTETEIPDQPSGTQAIYPSLLLAVAAIIPLLKWQD